MKTFLKVLLLAAVLVIAIKLSPLIFFGAIAGLIAAAVLGVVGIGFFAGLLAVLLALAVALSPIWIPVLVIMGLVALFRRSERPAAPPSAPMAPPPVAAA
jgi:hypothetical protein